MRLWLVMLLLMGFGMLQAEAGLSIERMQNRSSGLEKKISDITVKINADSIASVIEVLQDFGSRHPFNHNRYEVARWLAGRLRSYGYEAVVCDTFEAHIRHQTSYYSIDSVITQVNVYCDLPGEGEPEELTLLCAHYDSFNTEGDPRESAPGADDNASGVAALMEMARVLKDSGYTPKRSIRFAMLAAEELMYQNDSGSKHLAQQLKASLRPVRLVVNHDMIAHSSTSLQQSVVNINRHDGAQHFAQLAINSAETYTAISAQHSKYFGADLGPFVTAGFPGIYFEEADFSPYYHSSQDLLGNLQPDFCAEVTKASAATTIWSDAMPSIVEVISAGMVPGDSHDVRLLWRSNHDFDFHHYLVYYSTNAGGGFESVICTDTSLTLSNIPNPDDFRYALAAVSLDSVESFAGIESLNSTAVSEYSEIPQSLHLHPNYPNPCNPGCVFSFDLHRSASASLEIFNAMGRCVRQWEWSTFEAGAHRVEWDGCDFNGSVVSSGLYIFRLSAAGETVSRKMIVLK